MKVLRFSYEPKDYVLNINDIVYTLGNIVAVVDIYFKELSDKSDKDIPAKIQLIVNLDNLDMFMEEISSKTYIQLDSLGNYIESMKCFYKIEGYVEKAKREKVEGYLQHGPEESLLDWSDTINKKEDIGVGFDDVSWDEKEALGDYTDGYGEELQG